MNAIEQEVKHRREALPKRELPPEATRLWGLALSGGGIRSATFCLGLLRALARRDMLLRFDLLSTVSGGGYVGAMLGRLFGKAGSAADVERINSTLAGASSPWFYWWLRANGRYLIPRGAKDQTFAFALYIRNLIGVHFELGLLALLLGVLLASIDLAGWGALAWLGWQQPGWVFEAGRYLPHWMPVVVLLVPLVMVAGGVVASAYWCVPWLSKAARLWPAWLLALVTAGLLGALYWPLSELPSEVGSTLRWLLWGSTLGVLLSWLLAVPLACEVLKAADPALSPALRADTARSRLTKWLANCLRTAAVIVGVGVVDRVAWYLAFELQAPTQTGLLLGASAALVRVLLPAATRLLPGGGSTRALLGIGRLLGYGLSFLLCAWWCSLVYTAALGAAFQRAGPNLLSALAVLTAIAVPVLGYLCLTGRNLDFLNLSSLHVFYKARLIRSYLGAANVERFGRHTPLGAIEMLPTAMPGKPVEVAVGDLHAGDDIPLDQYRPQAFGGPVHLINSCINQTRDPRGGLFNQDRRGLALAVASGGQMQVSQEGWQPLVGRGALTLGSWMAISGAAVAPGLGSLTRGGISALATFAGLRLGYWWDMATRTNAASSGSPLTAKSVGLLRETFGIFRGTDEPDWFLTDGGHFENTGAYALLAERAEVIVLADCGADPAYAFGDLENLVRKARIDLQAEILFQRPKAPPPPPGPPAPSRLAQHYQLAKPAAAAVPPWPEEMNAFGSLNDLASSSSSACLALARIRYRGERPGRGILIVVKPNVSDGLPVDLVNFKAENPEFPQQTTADQFFSEAQWESYFQLGNFLGGKLSRDFIETLAADARPYFESDEHSLFDAQNKAQDESVAKAAGVLSRLPARIGSTAVNTTLGLGAVATLGISTWQAIDSVRTSFSKQTSDERAALKELSELWAKTPPAALPGQDTAAVSALAAAIVRTADTLCPSQQAGWFQQSPVAAAIHASALQKCEEIRDKGLAVPLPCGLLLEAANPSLQRPLPNCLVRKDGFVDALPPPRYWIYDYGSDAPFALAHPCDPIAADRRRFDELHRSGRVPADAGPAPLPPGCANAPPPVLVIAAQPSASVPPPTPPPPPPPPPATAPAPAPDPSKMGAAPTLPARPTVTAPEPSVEPPPEPTIATDVCRGKTIYLQIYGPAQLYPALANYRVRWQALGAKVAPVEDMLASARNAGRAGPIPVTKTTARHHDAGGQACAEALGPSLGLRDWRVGPLSPRLKPLPDTIEVWIPPLQPSKEASAPGQG